MTEYLTPTKAGLWLLEGGPGLAYAISPDGASDPAFWDKAAEHVADWPGFEARTRRWREQKAIDERRLDAESRIRSSREKPAIVDDPFDPDYHPILNLNPEHPESIAPDSGASPLGWCAPDGSWYSCGWAEHEHAAECIVAREFASLDFSNSQAYRTAHAIERGCSPHYDEANIRTVDDATRWVADHDAASFLLHEGGYCSLTCPTRDYWMINVPAAWRRTHARPTRAQRERMWDVLAVHGIESKVFSIEFFF